MNKESILTRIQELNYLISEVENQCREYCANQDIPIQDRWEVFKGAPNKKDGCFYPCEIQEKDIFPKSCLRFREGEYSAIELAEIFERAKRVREKYPKMAPYSGDHTEELANKMKNYFMVNYIGHFGYNE